MPYPLSKTVLLTSGSISENAFSKYPVSEIASYLGNNGISFSTILLTQKNIDSQIDYLISHLNGNSYYVFRPEGLSSVVLDIENIPTGLYRLSYVSSLASGYGRDYLPVEVEVYDVATPLTYERYCSSYQGSWMSIWKPKTSRFQYPQTIKNLEGVYFAGQRIMMPGGLPIAVYTGRRAVQLLCRDNKIEFV